MGGLRYDVRVRRASSVRQAGDRTMTQLNQEDTPQRTATRAPVNKPVRLQFDDSMDVVEGHCVNVSIGGMYIQLQASRPQGSLVRFELLIDEEHSIRGLGEVVWMRPSGAGLRREPGVGIKFRFLEQRDRQQIFKLVSQYIKDRLSQRPAMTSPPIEDAPEPVPEDGMIFRPPDDSSPEPLPVPPPAVESPSLPAAEDLMGAPLGPRRADSHLPDVEELSGPLDLVKEVEPWHENAEQEAASAPDSPPRESFSVDESPADDQYVDGGYLAPVRKRPPVFPLVVLSLLALIMVLAFFWGDLFGSKEPYAAGRPEVPPAESEVVPGPTAGGDREPSPATAASAEEPTPDLSPPVPAPSPVPASATTPPPTAAAPPPSAPPAPAAPFNRLLDITWRALPDGLEVIFTTNGSIPEKRWRHFRLSGDTPREVVRILGVNKPFDRTQIEVGGPGVRQIRLGYHKKSRGNELHVVMDMSSPQAKISEVQSRGSQLVVRVEIP